MEAMMPLISLLREQVCGGTVEESTKQQLSPDMLASVLVLSAKHDLTHLAGQALSNLKMLDASESSERFKKQTMGAMLRYVQMNSAYLHTCQILEKEKIAYLPLKGSVLRESYPDPWMRTSSDIDILVPEERLETAVEALTGSGFVRKGKSDHDLSLISPEGVHLELHFTTVDEGRSTQAQALLADMWQYAAPARADSCRYVLQDEMFYFYHFAHMAKHFEAGGCGIRYFLDIWVMNHLMTPNKGKRDALLEKGGLLPFAKAAEKLAEVWFSEEETDPWTESLARFVVSGGILGSEENAALVGQTKKGSKGSYLLSKVFLPQKKLQYYYPVLQEKPWLTSWYQVRRWTELLFSSKAKRSVRLLKINAEVSEKELASTAGLLRHLGLEE